jgi:hypothetical protein
MDEKVLEFYCQDEYLKQCHEEGKDIYASFAAKIFKVQYEDCLECKDGVVYPRGKARRETAKKILCACWAAYSSELSPFKWLNDLDIFLPGLTD